MLRSEQEPDTGVRLDRILSRCVWSIKRPETHLETTARFRSFKSLSSSISAGLCHCLTLSTRAAGSKFRVRRA